MWESAGKKFYMHTAKSLEDVDKLEFLALVFERKKRKVVFGDASFPPFFVKNFVWTFEVKMFLTLF